MSAIKKVILVDPDDQPIGEIDKILAHQYAMLHRAFSVFIFRYHRDELEVLLQQRSKKKYHTAGLWTNTCCSHPQPNENIIQSAQNRLKDEMGIEVKLKKVGQFHYVASVGNGLTENEIDHVFVGEYDGNEIMINPSEVCDYQWLNVNFLKQDLITNSNKYTPWFKQAFEIALRSVSKQF